MSQTRYESTMSCAEPTPVEVLVDRDRTIRVKVDGQTDEACTGQLQFTRNHELLADHYVNVLHTYPFDSVRAYEEAEAEAGHRLYDLLATSTAPKKPMEAIDGALLQSSVIRLVLAFDDRVLDEKPWELVSSPGADGVEIPWGVHPRIWLGRRSVIDAPATAPPFQPWPQPIHACVISDSSVAQGVHQTLDAFAAMSGRSFSVSMHPPSRAASTSGAHGRSTRLPIGQAQVGIYQYIGHGTDTETSFADQQGYEWGGQSISARDLKRRIDAVGGGPAALYVLLACHSAGCANASTTDEGAGYEQLVRAGAPVVIATQAVFSGVTAPAVTALLFAFLAKGQPIDCAAMNARRFAREVQLGLFASRAEFGIRCGCVYTWRQLAVAYADTRALSPFTAFSVDRTRCSVDRTETLWTARRRAVLWTARRRAVLWTARRRAVLWTARRRAVLWTARRRAVLWTARAENGNSRRCSGSIDAFIFYRGKPRPRRRCPCRRNLRGGLGCQRRPSSCVDFRRPQG